MTCTKKYDLVFAADVFAEVEIIKRLHICCAEAQECDGKW